MAKKIDPKAKAKRQKIYAGIGGVILLAVLAFQVPRTLKMLHPKNVTAASTAPAPTTTGSTPTPISAPSLAAATRPRRRLQPRPEATASATPTRFRRRNPASCSRSGSSARRIRSSSSSTRRARPAPPVWLPPRRLGRLQPRPTGAADDRLGRLGAEVAAGGVSSRAGGPATSAAISVNGAPESVKVGGTFPTSDPFFKLVSLTKKGAKISIAGGSLENGAPTITLTKNKPLTLMNTADGTRYVLRLVSVS